MRKIRSKSKKWESFEVSILELNQNDFFNYEEAEEGFFSYDSHTQTFKSRRTNLYEESLKTRLISDEVGNTYVNMSLLLHSKNQRFKRYWYVDYSFSDLNTALNSISQESSSLYQPFSSYISIHRFGGIPFTTKLEEIEKIRKYLRKKKRKKWRQRRLRVYSVSNIDYKYKDLKNEDLLNTFFPINKRTMSARLDWLINPESLSFIDVHNSKQYLNLLRYVGSRFTHNVDIYIQSSSLGYLIFDNHKLSFFGNVDNVNDKSLNSINKIVANVEHKKDILASSVSQHSNFSLKYSQKKEKFYQSYLLNDNSNLFNFENLFNFFFSYEFYLRTQNRLQKYIFDDLYAYFVLPFIEYITNPFDLIKGFFNSKKFLELKIFKFLNVLHLKKLNFYFKVDEDF